MNFEIIFVGIKLVITIFFLNNFFEIVILIHQNQEENDLVIRKPFVFD